jgi:drug/metabolite transporter (DMT)-like permease
MPAAPSHRMSPRAWAALLTLYVVWGSTYLGIRIAVESIPPFSMGAIRFLVAGAILYALTIRRGDRVGDRPGRAQWRAAAIAGTALLLGGMGMVAVGEQTVASGIAALFIATLPLWIALLGRVFLGERLTRPVLAGIVLGFAGVALLVAPVGGGAALDPVGLAALLVSPIAWASGTLYSRRAPLPRRPLVSTAMQMLMGGLALGAVAVLTGEPWRVRPEAVTPPSLAALAYLIGIGSLVGFTCYVWLLRNAPVTTIATYAYVNPVVAVALGAVVLGEPIGPRTLVAGAVIVVAVALIIAAQARVRDAEPPPPEG